MLLVLPHDLPAVFLHHPEGGGIVLVQAEVKLLLGDDASPLFQGEAQALGAEAPAPAVLSDEVADVARSLPEGVAEPVPQLEEAHDLPVVPEEKGGIRHVALRQVFPLGVGQELGQGDGHKGLPIAAVPFVLHPVLLGGHIPEEGPLRLRVLPVDFFQVQHGLCSPLCIHMGPAAHMKKRVPRLAAGDAAVRLDLCFRRNAPPGR